jgi:hypothetical protein
VEPINDEEASEIVRDIDGNEYDVVVVNGRKWLFQDLRTSKYRDGTAIPRVEDPAEWSQLNDGAYTWYDNDPANDETVWQNYITAMHHHLLRNLSGRVAITDL